LFTPVEEDAAGAKVGVAGVIIADADSEELEVALGAFAPAAVTSVGSDVVFLVVVSRASS
jgi:hypothetical protein